MAQYYFDFGKIVPMSIVDGAEFSGLIIKAGSANTEFPRMSASSIYDSLIGKKVLQFNPIDEPGVSLENSEKTNIRILLDKKISNFEVLIKGRASRLATWGAGSAYSGGLGFCFRMPSLSYDVTTTPTDFSKGGVIFSSGDSARSADDVQRVMRLYSAGNINSRAETTSNTYLPVSAVQFRHRYFLNIRIKVEGSNIKAKSWMSDVVEPAGWGINYNAANMPSEGYLGLNLSTWIEGRVIESMSIGTDGDTPPVGPRMYSISGMLLNPDDTLAVNKKVRIYDKKTGSLINEIPADSSGAYSFQEPVNPSNLIQIVGVDQDNNEWKPPIHEAYPVL